MVLTVYVCSYKMSYATRSLYNLQMVGSVRPKPNIFFSKFFWKLIWNNLVEELINVHLSCLKCSIKMDNFVSILTILML